MNLEDFLKDYSDGEEVVLTVIGRVYDPTFKNLSFGFETPDGLFSAVGHAGIIDIRKAGPIPLQEPVLPKELEEKK